MRGTRRQRGVRAGRERAKDGAERASDARRRRGWPRYARAGRLRRSGPRANASRRKARRRKARSSRSGAFRVKARTSSGNALCCASSRQARALYIAGLPSGAAAAGSASGSGALVGEGAGGGAVAVASPGLERRPRMKAEVRARMPPHGLARRCRAPQPLRRPAFGQATSWPGARQAGAPAPPPAIPAPARDSDAHRCRPRRTPAAAPAGWPAKGREC